MFEKATMFEIAAMLKFRYPTNRGELATEDLWDMPLTRPDGFSLDDLAKSLNRQVKESDEESFVVEKSDINMILETKFSIVKHIIKVKLDEIREAEELCAKRGKKEKILNIIAKKEDESLESESLDDLKKMANEL